jgi:hypothetical protein
MPWPDRFIASCRSWDDFWDRATKLSNTEKGIAFERLTQLYLQTAPEYRTKLQNVWLLRDIPPAIRRRLNLPAPDEGNHANPVSDSGVLRSYCQRVRQSYLVIFPPVKRCNGKTRPYYPMRRIRTGFLGAQSRLIESLRRAGGRLTNGRRPNLVGQRCGPDR